MPTFLRPGVYVQETVNPIAPIAGVSSNSVGAFIGANDRGPLTPTLVTSWNQYLTLFGGWNTVEDNALPIAVYMFFANGGTQAYVTRVVGSGAAAASRVLSDRAGSPVSTLTVTAKNPGTWGNKINIDVTNSASTGYFNLNVNYNGTGSAYVVERFTDITMDTTDARYALSVINSSSNYIFVADNNSVTTAPNNNPAVVSGVALTSGSTGSAVTSTEITAALTSYDTVMESLILNIPGAYGSDATTINAVISYAEDRGDVFVVIDGVDDTVSNQLSTAATYTASSRAAVYYPQVTISDPTLGLGASSTATKKIGAGAALVGIYCATDVSKGVFKAPAGLQTKVAGAVSVAPLSNTELDSLNSASAPVNAIRYIPGSGIVVMGARTLKTGYSDRYIPVRRSLIYLEKALSDLTQFAIFEPNDAKLWRRLDSVVSSFLTSFWSQGGLSGDTPTQAFFVKVDAENNTPATISNGEVHIEVGVALQRPAEFVVIKIGQYDGGTTVTVA